jgi:hypothetical protein
MTQVPYTVDTKPSLLVKNTINTLITGIINEHSTIYFCW